MHYAVLLAEGDFHLFTMHGRPSWRSRPSALSTLANFDSCSSSRSLWRNSRCVQASSQFTVAQLACTHVQTEGICTMLWIATFSHHWQAAASMSLGKTKHIGMQAHFAGNTQLQAPPTYRGSHPGSRQNCVEWIATPDCLARKATTTCGLFTAHALQQLVTFRSTTRLPRTSSSAPMCRSQCSSCCPEPPTMLSHNSCGPLQCRPTSKNRSASSPLQHNNV